MFRHHTTHESEQHGPEFRDFRRMLGRRALARHFARHGHEHGHEHEHFGNRPFHADAFDGDPREGGPSASGGPLSGGPFGGGPFGPGAFDRGGRGGPGRGGPGRGGPGRGGLGRFFAHGDLRLVLLSLIAERPRHGYELIKAVEERVAGAYAPSPGVIYPTLTLLEELGYVTVQAGDGKKLYEITTEGRAFLDANRGTVDALFARMDAVARAQGGPPAPPVIRAMENLRLALRMRMAGGPLDDAQIQAVAAALDAAAVAVERA